MIEYIRISNLSLQDTGSAEYQITAYVGYNGPTALTYRYGLLGADGLGPSEATLHSHPLPVVGGSLVSGLRRESKSLSFTFSYLSGLKFAMDHNQPTVAQHRSRLNMIISPGSRVRVEVKMGSRPGLFSIEGVVETLEHNYLSDTPLSQVTIYCGNPYFHNGEITRNSDIVVTSYNTSTNVFIARLDYEILNLNGSAVSPIKVSGTFQGGPSNAYIYAISVRKYRYNSWSTYLQRTLWGYNNDTGSHHVSGDTFEYSSGYNDIINITKNDESMVSRIRYPSDWVSMNPGPNRISIWVEGRHHPMDSKIGELSLISNVRYEGI